MYEGDSTSQKDVKCTGVDGSVPNIFDKKKTKNRI